MWPRGNWVGPRSEGVPDERGWPAHCVNGALRGVCHGLHSSMLHCVTRWFNTAGPCVEERHYMVPAKERLPEVQTIIDRLGYFIVHAPRQSGKTTTLVTLAKSLTQGGKYAAVLVSMIAAADRPFRNNEELKAIELAVLASWRAAVRDDLPVDLQPPPWPDAPAGTLLGAALAAWAEACPRPLVVFLDEFDALRGELLTITLRQLQAHYRHRPKFFPHSIALVGLRDLKDYRFGEDDSASSTPSPFNIVVSSLTLPFFTLAEIKALFDEYTKDTGQPFDDAAAARVEELTLGQPWLVNALAAEVTDNVIVDRSTPIGVLHIEKAKENLLSRRTTHLDSLTDRLRDERVRSVIEPMLEGDLQKNLPADHLRYTLDLGLVRTKPDGGLEMANPIYREVVARELSLPSRSALPQIAPTWLSANGRLDSEKLLAAFVAFWKRHGEPLLKSAPYSEVAAHLVLMAFLDRVANGGGLLEREYAIGRGRLDLCLKYGKDVLGIEVKVWRDRRPDPLADGLTQLDGYLAGLGLNWGWMVIFDARTGEPPVHERTRVESATTPNGRQVVVIRA